MTHDELLAELDSTYDFKTARALRAVVELHKPVKHCNNPKCPGPVCSECGSIETLQIEYPCPTIQAIEKELS